MTYAYIHHSILLAQGECQLTGGYAHPLKVFPTDLLHLNNLIFQCFKKEIDSQNVSLLDDSWTLMSKITYFMFLVHKKKPFSSHLALRISNKGIYQQYRFPYRDRWSD